MYILNKSCNVDIAVLQEFKDFIKNEYAPYFSEKYNITDYRCSQLLLPTSDDPNSKVVIVQFFLDEISEDWEEFIEENISDFSNQLMEKFGTKVLAFQTLMKVLPQ